MQCQQDPQTHLIVRPTRTSSFGCHGACQLHLDPWRRLECGRKECGVTLSGRMECGVTPSGRRISLKGAVAHLLLSFLLPFPFSRNNLFPEFLK